MSSRRITPNPDNRKTILFLAMLAIVLSGLFPPWLYTYDRSSSSDRTGGHWEVSAGYASIFKPPNGDTTSTIHDYGALAGVKLDVTRLLVEWVCILAVGGTAWGVAWLNRAANQKEESASEP
jgi:hypothetical protein